MPAPRTQPKSDRHAGVPELLTARQAAILDFIETTVHTRKYPPTMREIGVAVGLSSTSSVRHQILTLHAKGYLYRDAARPRAYVIRDAAPPAEETLAAHIRQAATDVPLPPEYADGHFPLRMAGNAMREAAIRDGDILIISRHDHAADGDLVAALIGDRATIRQLRQDRDHTWLQARAAGYPELPADGAMILGRVVAVLRHL